VRPDLCATDCPREPGHFLGRFWTDSLVHDPKALDLLVHVLGRDRVMLGTDYPFPLGEVTGFAAARPGKAVEESALNDEVKRLVLAENALDFLRLDASDYE